MPEKPGRFTRNLAALLAVALPFAAGAAGPPVYPAKPIRFIVTFAAGGERDDEADGLGRVGGPAAPAANGNATASKAARLRVNRPGFSGMDYLFESLPSHGPEKGWCFRRRTGPHRELSRPVQRKC